jgi:hypothetical protein
MEIYYTFLRWRCPQKPTIIELKEMKGGVSGWGRIINGHSCSITENNRQANRKDGAYHSSFFFFLDVCN